MFFWDGVKGQKGTWDHQPARQDSYSSSILSSHPWGHDSSLPPNTHTDECVCLEDEHEENAPGSRQKDKGLTDNIKDIS